MNSKSARYQQIITLPACAFEIKDPDSKKFAGWSRDPDDNKHIEYMDKDEIEVICDMTLYAHSEDISTSDYMVKHLFQNIDDDGYTEDLHNHHHQIFEGSDGTLTNAKALVVPGFEAKPFDQKKIEDDAKGLKTIVEIYYDRIPVTLTFDLAGGTMTSPALFGDKLVLRYGAKVPASVVAEKRDHKLTGWNPELPTEALADGHYTAEWAKSYTYIPGAEGGLSGTSTKKQGDIAKASIRGLPNTADLYVVPEGTIAKINTDGSFIWDPNGLGTEEAHVHGAFHPQREIHLSPYIISQHPVTLELYESIMSSYHYSYTFNKSKGPKLPYGSDPVNDISWYDAVRFCNLLSVAEGLDPVYYYINVKGEKVTDPKAWPIGSFPEILCDHTKNGYRLPTNAEWEFAARGGDPSADCWHYAFSGADLVHGANVTKAYEEDANLSTVAYYKFNTSQQGPCNVGHKKPNRLGIYDMSGGICEWTYDYINKDFSNVYEPYTNAAGIVVDPRGTEKGRGKDTLHSLRGGSFFSSAFYCTVTYILSEYPNKTKFSYGFRLCRNAE